MKKDSASWSCSGCNSPGVSNVLSAIAILLSVCLFIIRSVEPYMVNKPTGYRVCQENTNRI